MSGPLAACRGNWRRWRVAHTARRLVSGLDAERLAAIRARWRDADPEPGYSKYLEIERWMRVAVHWLHDAGLARERSCRVLDLGTGCGYFPYAAGRFGHRVRAIDLGGNAFYDEMVALLGVDRVAYPITAGEPLPDLGGRFDLVTGFMICFNNHARDDLWGPAEWAFFLRDLTQRVLAPDGRVLLHFNPEPDGTHLPPAVECLFRGAGADVRGGVVRLRAPFPV